MDDGVNAMRDYQAAIELDETYSLAYFNAGNVYFHSRQFSQVNYFTAQAVLSKIILQHNLKRATTLWETNILVDTEWCRYTEVKFII
jgi:hypothetical protein